MAGRDLVLIVHLGGVLFCQAGEPETSGSVSSVRDTDSNETNALDGISVSASPSSHNKRSAQCLSAQGQILPHELMLLIADMLASAHLYRTLGTLGLASRALNEDITPKLYGTMLCDRSWRMDWELRDGRLIPKELDQLPLSRWKHAKWVDAGETRCGEGTDQPRLQDTWWKISAGVSYAIDSPTFQTLRSVSTSTPATCPDRTARNALAMFF